MIPLFLSIIILQAATMTKTVRLCAWPWFSFRCIVWHGGTTGRKIKVGKGSLFIMPAGEPHALQALSPFMMMPVMIKTEEQVSGPACVAAPVRGIKKTEDAAVAAGGRFFNR
jgi:hypothetical protein